MFNAIVKVQHWWNNGRQPAGPTVPFELTCVCGRAHSGQRTSRPQALTCSGCGRSLFIFPISPLPSVGEDGKALPPPTPAIQHRPFWFWPAIGAGSTLVVVALVFTILMSTGVFHRLASGTSGSTEGERATVKDVEKPWAAGRKALATGDFKQAARDLSTARALLDQNPGLLSRGAENRLRNQEREAELLSNWPGKPLDRILADMERLDPTQWQTLIRSYQGRGFFFDGQVQPDGQGGYRVDFRRPAAGGGMRLDLRGFKLVGALRLNEHPRLIFGGRIAELRREPEGTGVVRLDADSGVLLTDVDAANICTGNKIDEELQEVIRRQTATVEKGR